MFALLGALGGAAVVGFLGLFGQSLQSKNENQRLKRQLNHERELRDLEALRILLGDAAEALGVARKAWIRLGRFWGVSQVGSGAAKRDEAQLEQRESAGATRSALDRLRIHLDPTDPTLAAYEHAMVVLDAIAELYSERPSPQTHNERLQQLGDELGTQMVEFARLARAKVAPRLPRGLWSRTRTTRSSRNPDRIAGIRVLDQEG